MSAPEHLQFTQIEFEAVTADGFRDVSIMTMGEADGHGVMVDEKTIEQFIRLSLGKSIPAYLTHDGAVDSMGRPKDRLGKEIGMFSGFYRDGNRVRARNFQFLDSFKKAEPRVYQTLVEMAKGFSDKLGISPVIRTLKAWVMKDGSEVADDGKGIPANLADDMPHMRIGELLSCDFVARPATNLGLFEAKVDDKTQSKEPPMSDTILLTKHTEELTALSTQHKDAIMALETKHKDAVIALEAKINEHIAQAAKSKEEITGLTSALAAKTKEAEDAAKYDMRKAGAPALQVALDAHAVKIPAPADTDAGRWSQYAALCEEVKDGRGNVLQHKETAEAKAFREKHLTRK